MSEQPTLRAAPQRLVDATVRLLAESGPSAIKARTVAAEAGMSTMVVYHHFGGLPELMREVIDFGYAAMEQAFSHVAVTSDPMADLAAMALLTRRLARGNPHLYDLMFGLSTRATYRPTSDTDARRSGHSPAFQAAYRYLTDACTRLVESGRVHAADPRVVAASLWSIVHGYVSLELGDHFAEFDDPVVEVMGPATITFAVGLGDTADRASASFASALRTDRSTPAAGDELLRSGKPQADRP